MKTYQYRFIGRREDIDNTLTLFGLREIRAENVLSDFEITYGGNAGASARHFIVRRHSFNDTDRALLGACNALFPSLVWEVLDASGERVHGEGAANFEGRMPVIQHWERRDHPLSWNDLKAKHDAALKAAYALYHRGGKWGVLAQCIYCVCSMVAIASGPEQALEGLRTLAVFDDPAHYFPTTMDAVAASLGPICTVPIF